MTEPLWAQTGTNPAESTPKESSRRIGARASGDPDRAATRRNWLREPKSAVWMALAVIVLVGGGRRLLWAWRARKAVSRLSDPGVAPQEIEAVAEYGRAGAWELLRIFSTSEAEPTRTAAGRALARLWRDDELVAEEEQAVVRRGFSATWFARRRYPRSLRAPIPVIVTYNVPFLPDEPAYIRGVDLEWSCRIIGARRAALEEFSPWKAGRGEASFAIIPGDFPTDGPHRLVLQARVRTAGLSDAWEIELPHVPFQFDFDPVLRLDAILALTDAVRDEAIARAIRLEPAPIPDSGSPRLVPLGGEWMLRHPPRLAVETPLPSDLAHQVSIEFEGDAGRFSAGTLILSGQGLAHRAASPTTAESRRFDLELVMALADGVIEQPGMRRMRAHLVADPQLGWAHPEIRSVWPGDAETNWVEVEIVRR
jgi:hypothetical protein